MVDVLDTILRFTELITLLIGAITGWLGKKGKDRMKVRKVEKQLQQDYEMDIKQLSKIIDEKVKRDISKYKN